VEYRYTAIILKKKEIGETDRLYTVYTREAGKLKVVARGVRKQEAKLASQLETMNLVSLSVQRGRGQGKIAGAIAEESFLAIRRDEASVFEILRVFDIVDRLVGLEERDETLFSLLERFLRTTDTLIAKGKSEKVSLLLHAFLFHLFAELGYQIEAGVCAATGERLDVNDRLFFSPAAGGVIASLAAGTVPQAIPMSVESVKLLRIILSNAPERITKIAPEKRTVQELALATTRFIDWIVR
jgi:DNA repair protein RecO (recombination protein O)